MIDGQQLWARGGGLLDALIGRVANMRVDRGVGRCPLVTLRGERTLVGSPDPQIYVDGTLIGNTCILEQIRVVDVARVEVYPGGFTPRPGYRSSPNGLFLVFLTGPPVRR